MDQLSTLGEDSNASAPLENDYGVQGDPNYVKITVGDLASNVTDPILWYDFIQEHPENVGNGFRGFDIMDRSLAENVILKFEIQAEYGVVDGNIINSFEGNQCENPTLYVWETDEDGKAIDVVNEIPIPENYSDFILLSDSDLPGFGPYGGDWDTFIDLLLDSDISGEIDQESWDVVRGLLVQAEFTSFATPDYLVEAMPVTFSDELGADQNWTDLIYGVRFKFDNGYLYYN